MVSPENAKISVKEGTNDIRRLSLALVDSELILTMQSFGFGLGEVFQQNFVAEIE